MTRRSPFRVPVGRVREVPSAGRLRGRALALTAASAALVTLSGCMTVHGEREVVPAVSTAEAAKVLQQFADSYNNANRTLDPKLAQAYETGTLLAIDEAVLKSQRAMTPQGNRAFRPLTFQDANFTVPKQAGWPKFFVADAVSSLSGTSRMFLTFTRDSVDAKWKAAYRTALSEKEIPQFVTDKDGYAEAVQGAAAKSGLQVAPDALSKAYATYLRTGKASEGAAFAPGQYTDGWRTFRDRSAKRPGARIQWKDQASDHAPFALRTKDGGALVFFSTVYHMRKTVAKGSEFGVPAEMKGILDGPMKKTDRMTFTTVSEQVVKVPARGGGGGVQILHRNEGLTYAKAE